MKDDSPAATVAIVGCGLIGRAWAMVFARGGWRVRLWDPAEGVAEQALALCRQGLADLHAHGLCSEPETAADRVSAASTLEMALRHADFVQESGPEQLEAKRALFRRLDAATAPAVVLASSTSGLRCSEWSAELPGAARCLVGHPVNPPHLVPLVELSGAPWTAAESLDRAHAVYLGLGQVPVRLRREVEGFVLNRLQAALLTEAFRLVSEGTISPQDLDATVKHGLGLRWAFMGPFETIELNAPGGIPDYVARFREGFLSSTLRDPAGPDVFDGPAVARIMSEWRAAPDIPDRTRWRDNRLAALRAHLARQEDRPAGATASSCRSDTPDAGCAAAEPGEKR